MTTVLTNEELNDIDERVSRFGTAPSQLPPWHTRFARAVEAAVLAKIRQNARSCINYPDGRKEYFVSDSAARERERAAWDAASTYGVRPSAIDPMANVPRTAREMERERDRRYPLPTPEPEIVTGPSGYRPIAIVRPEWANAANRERLEKAGYAVIIGHSGAVTVTKP